MVQRCRQANVNVRGNTIGEIGIGFVVLLGIQKNDSVSDADYIVKKLSTLRIFSDSNEKMNLSIKDIEGSALIISQFTLCGDTRKGRRPSFVNAELPEKGKELYNYFLSRFKKDGIQIQTVEFGAMMEVSLINNGPVTLILNSRDR